MKTGFIRAYLRIPKTKFYGYHGIIMPCNQEPNPSTSFDYDTSLEGILLKLEMTTIHQAYSSMVDKNEDWSAGPEEIRADNEFDYLKTYNIGHIVYDVELFSERWAPLIDVEKFNYLLVRAKVKAVQNYAECRSWIAPDECDPGKIILGYMLKAGGDIIYKPWDTRKILPNNVTYTHIEKWWTDLKDSRNWRVSDLDKLGMVFYLRDCYPTWPAEYTQNWAFIYFLELWVHVTIKT